ncbi:hypothetical protein VB773_21920 [Haloarculaceae archaeon H-GB2-1]|nr:hypothetical protein [Haloarculaceae archaeon H-GB1-1]MEA5389584.1 hypothetical protein [Haloarculaceae archaeon H-GB11]MEA5409963.1 hypothetical protein [Haloarculaceae archaeon H-GB2-1]
MSRNERSRISTVDDVHDGLFLTPVSVDRLFDVLAHPGRRYLLAYLLEHEEASCYELVEHVLDRTDVYEDRSEGEIRGQLVETFRETHLPVLDDAGFVTYNEETDLVRPTVAARSIEPFLELAKEYQQEYVDRAVPS